MAHTILAIDDHPETLSILVTALQGHGYHVVSSQSPFKGLQLVESEKPDLLLVDMNMPEMNGIELVRRVRALEQVGTIPIMMFTAETDAATKTAGFQAGVDDYITKPTDPMELIERVEALLSHVPEPDPELDLQLIKTPDPFLIREQDELPVPPPVAERGKLIALCGVRGGVGTTTVAINLAYVLAQAKHETTLVDFDLRQGHIGLYLNQKIAHGLNSVADLDPAQLRPQLMQQRVAYRPSFHLMLTQPNMNGRQPTPTAPEMVTILDILLQPGQYVVADLGLGATNLTQPVLERADHLILCLSPERIALAAAKRYIADIKASLLFHTALHVLICDMKKGINLTQQAIEKYLSHPVLDILPIPYRELVKASNKGVALAQAFPKSTTLAALHKISLKLVATQK